MSVSMSASRRGVESDMRAGEKVEMTLITSSIISAQSKESEVISAEAQAEATSHSFHSTYQR
jgi:hypothetical protein